MYNNIDRKDVIPSMDDYRTRVRELYKVKPKRKRKPTRRMVAENRRLVVQAGDPKRK